MSLAAKLHDAIEAVCPIDGVSIGRSDDASSWRIAFRPEATKEQKDAALAVLAAFDPAAPENQPPPLIDIDAELAAIKVRLANSETAVAESKATMAALIKKAVLTTEEIETKNDEKAKP